MVAETATESPKTKPKGSKPPKTGKKDEVPKAISFFDRMAAIQKEDWGTRAKVKVYRLEPLIDQVRISGRKYVAIYEEALTEERLKQDCGSGRYRLYLTFKGPTDFDKEIDSVEIEVFDAHFPPKIPPGAWLDDPRNKKWDWAKPLLETKEQPNNGAAALGGLADTLRAVKEILPQPQNKAAEVLDTIRAVKEMNPPPSTENGLLNSIVELVKTQNTTAQAALTAAQERADRLMLQLLESRKGSGMETFKTVLSDVKEVLGVTTLKNLFSMGKEAVEATRGKSRMSGWMEFSTELLNTKAVSGIVDFVRPFGVAMAQNMMARAAAASANGTQQPMQPATALPPAAQTQGQPQPQPPQQPNGNINVIAQAIGQIAQPMLNYIRMDADAKELGEDFANWIYDGFGVEPFERIRPLGAQNLVMLLRNNPIWHDKGPQANLKSLEELGPKVDQFMSAFLAWQPPADEEDEPEDAKHSISLEQEVFGS